MTLHGFFKAHFKSYYYIEGLKVSDDRSIKNEKFISSYYIQDILVFRLWNRVVIKMDLKERGFYETHFSLVLRKLLVS